MKPMVYWARVADGAGAGEQAEAAQKVFLATGFEKKLKKMDLTAIKVHVGEKNNVTHVKPEIVAALVEIIKKARALPFITDTSTLYRGRRENAVKHALHAHSHGFSIANTGAPFLPLDGLAGTDEAEVEVNGELHRSVKVAGQVMLADALIVVSHATGHIEAGFGAAIKNVGMGLSSRAGKMRQHSSIKPEVKKDKCENCGKCRRWCPAAAIGEREGISYIFAEKCLGCGECIAVCRYDAIKFDYKIASPILQKSIVEHAAGVVRRFGDKAVYLNVLTDMTRNCDCFNTKQDKFVPDVGVLASADLVAVEQATLDLTERAHGKSLAQSSFPKLDPMIQMVHAEKLGLGRRDYELREIS